MATLEDGRWLSGEEVFVPGGLWVRGVDEDRSVNPSIAVEGNKVYVVWHEDSTVLIRNSIDGGTNFQDSIILGNRGGDPNVAALENNVYVVWTSNDVEYPL